MSIKISVMLHAPRASILNNALYSRKMCEDIYSTHGTPLTAVISKYLFTSAQKMKVRFTTPTSVMARGEWRGQDAWPTSSYSWTGSKGQSPYFHCLPHKSVNRFYKYKKCLYILNHKYKAEKKKLIWNGDR